MEIIRLPKNAVLAHLTVSESANGRVSSSFSIRGPMTGFAEHAEYENVEQAEQAAVASAQNRKADYLLIDDKT